MNSSGGTNEPWKEKLMGNSVDSQKPQKEDFELMEGGTNEYTNISPKECLGL